MMLEEINDCYDEWMKDLAVREKHLKDLITYDSISVDELINLLKENYISE